MTNLTTEEIKHLFNYKDGALYWKISPARNTSAGARAGTSKGRRYESISIKGKMYTAHPIIWLWHDMPCAVLLDHINGNRFDNRIENLRAATASQNQHNRGAQKNSSTGIKGVFVENGRFCARIQLNGKRQRLGGFATLDESVASRSKADPTLTTLEQHT